MASQQPFRCLICQSRFTRNENLKRHTALHSQPHDKPSLPCPSCSASFSRSDLRQRHLKRKHPDQIEDRTPKTHQREVSALSPLKTQEAARDTKVATTSQSKSLQSLDQLQSTDEGMQEEALSLWQRPLDLDCQFQYRASENLHSSVSPMPRPSSTSESTYSSHIEPDTVDLEQDLLLGASVREPANDFDAPTPSMSPPSAASNTGLIMDQFAQRGPDVLTPTILEYLRDEWLPSTTQTARGVDLFFTHISPFVPFLHQPTFDPTSATPPLLLSILCLAYQHGEDPDLVGEADSGVHLSIRCFHRARALLAASDEESPGVDISDIVVIQAYLLLQICAMMYLCGKNSAYGLQMHSKLIFLARTGGLMQPLPSNSASTGDLESLWHEFVQAESRKRTVFAIHQIDALWYQILSIPRSLSHLEVKYELPCPEDCWAASSCTQWAHRQLLVQRTSAPIPYAKAVRRFLSSDLDASSLHAFDAYGAINIAQFLISSAREITGWSTMTGQLSIERFEPLRSSLVALQPFICPTFHDVESTSKRTTHPVLCEATWEMAMIELQMWSPSHTGGMVEGSVDAVLQQSTYQTPSYEFLVETNTAKTIQPHVNWFLHYLDVTRGVELGSEPPWVALYALKAFLIAWRLVCGGLWGAMQVVGVHDGDARAALGWAKEVFQRRCHRQLGKLILRCLDTLDA